MHCSEISNNYINRNLEEAAKQILRGGLRSGKGDAVARAFTVYDYLRNQVSEHEANNFLKWVRNSRLFS